MFAIRPDPPGASMTYIIAEPCINLKDRSCVDVCPVDCIYEGEDQLYIHPDECIDRGDRTLGLAGTAIDALVGVDVELILALVDTVHRTDIHAGAILQIDARLGDNVRHRGSRRIGPNRKHRRGPTPVTSPTDTVGCARRARREPRATLTAASRRAP